MKYLSFISMASLTLASSMLLTGQANATIYKCVKPTGKVFYNDKPCASKEAETKLKHEKAPKNPYIPKAVVVLTDPSVTVTKSSLVTAVEKQNVVVNNSSKLKKSETIKEENDLGLLASEEGLKGVAESKERQEQRARFAKREEESSRD